MSTNNKLILQVFLLVFLVSGISLLARVAPTPSHPLSAATSTQPAAVVVSAEPAATSTQVVQATTTPVERPKNTAQQSQNTEPAKSQAERVAAPYSTPPLDFDAINAATRAALVNIFCTPHGGTLRPISGSGIIIDSKGVILTNAHVAQYVLLSESPQINLQCSIRVGSPASATYRANVLYIPKVWVDEHASEINAARPLGTGEHDYALLQITTRIDGAPLPSSFASIGPDTREAIAFVDDNVLGAGYPAEFAAGSVQSALYPVSSISKISKLFTFGSGSVDVISIGSVIEAQSGSSGGPIVNAWQRLVGIITTTSEGATTADRQLRGVTLSYIDRDITAQTGQGLTSLISGDTVMKTADFTDTKAADLIGLYVPFLKK